MIFASNLFIFVFLPIVLILYYSIPNIKYRNTILLLSSLGFYWYGEPRFVFIMLLSIVINYFIGLLIDKNRTKKKLSKFLLSLSVIYNLGLLFIYKYLIFTLSIINSIFPSHIKLPNIVLPIGISFFTFQILSYVIDVYTKKAHVQKNILNLALYISFFPQLIAGPIVRYNVIEEQIVKRKGSLDLFLEGIKRFIIGLGKKVVIANTMGYTADYIFKSNISTDGVSFALVWLGAICYTFQIYYDFSGYSDMAIGLGKMFAFNFEENFNYPYISKSITEFWRRWHISLGTWFRDYVYIPLGGNRKSKIRTIINLGVVWLLTGLWHGANWTFIAWGIMYYILLCIEKIFDLKNKKIPNVIRYIYTMLFVIIGWVIFRSDSLLTAFNYIKRMFTFNNFVDLKFYELLIENLGIILMALLFSFPIIKTKIFNNKYLNYLKWPILIIVFIISVSYITKGTYNPFIYFNF